jgi:Ca2+/H+ antiporter
MIWWFLILGCSTLVVVCVAIALYMRLRRHLRAAHAAREESSSEVDRHHSADKQ